MLPEELSGRPIPDTSPATPPPQGTSDAERGRALAEGAAEWGIDLTDVQLERFARFAALLEAGNTRLNLTRIRPEDRVALHFLDSLALAAVARLEPDMDLIDVGTGGGFPGIPLAIAFPELNVTLLDGTRKRLAFLDEVIADLGLTRRVRTLHARAEELARNPARRERYDFATARAVAKMPTLAGWLLPLVKPGGLAVAYKSRDAAVEIEAARPEIVDLSGRIERIADIRLPGTEIERKLVLIRKTRPISAGLHRDRARTK
jgi:16S rRNA (guanine527-N7)-methyltransferase